VLHLLLLIAVGGVFVFLLVLGLAFVSGWTPSDGRDILLNRAFHTVIEDGVRLDGVQLPWPASVVIRVLGDPNDSRLRLIAEPRDGPAGESSDLQVLREPI
jgi:hypothetical protein